MKALLEVLSFAIVFSTLTGRSFGQDSSFKAGEIVIVKMYGKLEEAQVVRQDASGVVVRQKDWQDGTYKADGPTRSYRADEVTRKQAATNTPAGPATASGIPIDYARSISGPTGQDGGAGLGGTGPLSKQQILDYLSVRVGTDGPHPKKEQVSKVVCDDIKKRGVNFKYASSDGTLIALAGGDTTVSYTIASNFGTPTEMPWFQDEWDLWFTTTSGFTPSLDSGAKLGFLSIEPDNKYLWKVSAKDAAKNWIDGKWRKATPEEMKYTGGAGIVLMNGEQGFDWIVLRDEAAKAGEEWIRIADLATRQEQRGGKRKPATDELNKK